MYMSFMKYLHESGYCLADLRSCDDRDDDRPRRRRRSVEDADEYDEMPRRRRRSAVDDSRDEESFEERALDAVDMLPEGHEVRHNPRPMMSLLFQEPVLPSAADSRDRLASEPLP